MPLSDTSAVIFDLDGTLIDSLGIWNAVDRALVTALGHPELSDAELCRFREAALARHADTPNAYVGFCGDLGELCGAALPAAEIHAMRYRISRQMLRTDIRPKPGAGAFLRAVKAAGLRAAVATTTKRANIDIYASDNPYTAPELLLDSAFETILTREDVTRIKPDPEIYLTALSRLGLPASQCAVFEDSLAGAQAATAAGLTVYIIDDFWSAADAQALCALGRAHFADWQEALNTFFPAGGFSESR